MTHSRRFAWVAVAIVVLGLAALWPLVARQDEPREIVVVARGMRFFVEGTAGPNPPIRLVPGERVRLTLVNQDRGVGHDLAIPALDVRTGVLRDGDRASVVFRVPSRPGSLDYLCTRHEVMMRGTVDVRSLLAP